MELEKLQAQLKSQIQEHQVLVKQIKSDPQNPDLQKRLRVLQTYITTLSEQQNRVVKQLRQELLKSQACQDGKNGEIVSSAMGKIVNIKQEPVDDTQESKTVVMRSVSVGTQNLPHLKPKPKPVVIVSSQSGKSFICKSPTSPFSLKSPSFSTANRPFTNAHVPSSAVNMVSFHKNRVPVCTISHGKPTVHLPQLLPKPPLIMKSKEKKFEEMIPVEPKKLEFMQALGLITPQTMIEIQAKRQERKRRSHCISPYSSLLMEPEPKKMKSMIMLPVKRGRGKSRPPKYHSSSAPCSPKTTSPIPNGLGESGKRKFRYRRFITAESPADEDDDHDDACALCKASGELLLCDTCNLVYHLKCLDPPLTTLPTAMWVCPKCKEAASGCDTTLPWPGMLSVVRSYMAHKTAKEDEKNYLIKRSQELQAEKMELEAKAKRLSQSIMEQMQAKSELSTSNRVAKNSVDKLIQFIELVQSL